MLQLGNELVFFNLDSLVMSLSFSILKSVNLDSMCALARSASSTFLPRATRSFFILASFFLRSSISSEGATFGNAAANLGGVALGPICGTSSGLRVTPKAAAAVIHPQTRAPWILAAVRANRVEVVVRVMVGIPFKEPKSVLGSEAGTP